MNNNQSEFKATTHIFFSFFFPSRFLFLFCSLNSSIKYGIEGMPTNCVCFYFSSFFFLLFWIFDSCFSFWRDVFELNLHKIYRVWYILALVHWLILGVCVCEWECECKRSVFICVCLCVCECNDFLFCYAVSATF